MKQIHWKSNKSIDVLLTPTTEFFKCGIEIIEYEVTFIVLFYSQPLKIKCFQYALIKVKAEL